MKRGRARGNQKRIREAIDNIILDELAPAEQVREDCEMIDALHQKEDTIAAEIESLDADIAETIAKVDLLRSTRAREQGRSRVGSPTPSVNDGCSSTRSYGELSLGQHGAPVWVPTDHRGRTAPPMSSDSASRAQSLKSVVAQSVPVPALEVFPSVSHRPATSTEVSRLKFAQCEDAMSLSRHYTSVEAILAEANAGTLSGETFVPHRHLRVACVSRLVSSLKPVALKSAAEDQALSTQWDWCGVKAALLGQFCRRSILQKAYATSISRLSFPGVAHCDNFLNEADRIVNLHRDAFEASSSERRVVIRAIVGRLPREIRGLVIRAIRDCRLDVDALDREWELLLPWRGRVAGDLRSVREVIRSICRSSEDVELAANPLEAMPVPKHDQISFAGGSAKGETKAARTSGNLENWVKGFAKALVVTGDGCEDEFQMRDILFAKDARFFRSRRGAAKPYVIACYGTESAAIEATARLEGKGYKQRPFVFRGVSSSANPASMESGNC
ncbi:hypothetical protein Pmar_PMAR016415 [Perkinsus marinus ATCC 50983]|uniref:Uncharacterized protein n=1 Tax=Perkinsus marinus (strain ATCC 50983 / TXsc) TaxID=423536 RepID=C5L177_PERM5|nr:hypothetical protein Pmar_PMAR016415 [Perkinsus marinus ATCC 50983]EER09484.1 hypothetical protein Pmar_PMAR016415 [Perkinsus marinus ATCC 50983]|eukprot:XP_002777668.1 hypothetical protein Pmar_PMAR016415 [Perkinsus marinus ATCC 50983]